MKTTIYSIALLLLPLVSLQAQNLDMVRSNLVDPGIRDGEYTSYLQTQGEETTTIESIVHVSESDTGKLYLYSTIDDIGERTLSVDAGHFIPVFAESISNVQGSMYETQTRIIQAPAIGIDELFVIGVGDLMFLLRAYPFARPRPFTIQLIGQDREDSEFELQIEYRRSETIEVAGSRYSAHKLELVTHLPGALALFRGMVPKTFFWYNSLPPHQLLRYEGSNGFGGDGELVLEMQSYSRAGR